MSEEYLPDFEIRVMFADGSTGELRTVPLNIGNRMTVLYEITEDSQSLTFAGVPTPDEGETVHEMITGLLEYLYETVKQGVTAEMLEKEENN